jgi:hypothetical protein
VQLYDTCLVTPVLLFVSCCDCHLPSDDHNACLQFSSLTSFLTVVESVHAAKCPLFMCSAASTLWLPRDDFHVGFHAKVNLEPESLERKITCLRESAPECGGQKGNGMVTCGPCWHTLLHANPVCYVRPKCGRETLVFRNRTFATLCVLIIVSTNSW